VIDDSRRTVVRVVYDPIMRLDLDLLDGTLAGHLDWNSATGDLSAPLADEVRELVEAAIEAGGVSGDPVPTFYRVTNPLRRPAELAVVLAERWAVPHALLPAYDALVARKVRANPAPLGAVY
jgi:hypothetical protein